MTVVEYTKLLGRAYGNAIPPEYLNAFIFIAEKFDREIAKVCDNNHDLVLWKSTHLSRLMRRRKLFEFEHQITMFAIEQASRPMTIRLRTAEPL